MKALVRSLWLEPAEPDVPARGWMDWLLFVAFAAIGVAEVTSRADIGWTSPSVWVGMGLVPTLLFRRSHPLAMVLLAFVANAALDAVGLWTGRELSDLNTTAFVLLLPYSLLRWGTGRQVTIGVVAMSVSAVLANLVASAPIWELVAGLSILFSSMAVGVALRYRARARRREVEQLVLQEREELARELHDTVAHHVSAIAIRAQAGLAVAPTKPEASAEALRLIETEAKKTLSEMRAIVRVLRRGESPERGPQPRASDLERLARATPNGPDVVLDVSGDLDELAPSVSAAVYRLAQESITNARRHARRATRIDVGVTADASSVRIRVSDDGDVTEGVSGPGYGLVGMVERAELLGGTCVAGPDPERGWTVTAVLPRKGELS